MPTEADILFRDFVRYTGDGLPNEPVGRPAPIGDPASGTFDPPKKSFRDLGNIAVAAKDAAVAAAGEVLGAVYSTSDVQTLLAASQSFPAGTVFQTRAEGMAFEVPTDPAPTDLTTAGGTRLRLVASDSVAPVGGGIVPMFHFRQAATVSNPKIVIMGDSISTPAPSYTADQTDSMWGQIKRAFTEANPHLTPQFVNMAWGTRTWTNPLQTVASQIAAGAPVPGFAYGDGSGTWLSYVQAQQPDILILAFGMNDRQNFVAAQARGVIDNIRTWAKVPDLMMVTPMVPNRLSADTDMSSEEAQQGRYYNAHWTRSWALYNRVALLDLNRQYARVVQGIDPRNTFLTLDGPASTQPLPYTFPNAVDQDFGIEIVSGNRFPITSGMKLTTSLAGPNSYSDLRIAQSGGNVLLRFSTVHASDGTPSTPLDIATGVPVPTGGFTLSIFIKDCWARLVLDGTTLYDGPIVRHGGRFTPVLSYLPGTAASVRVRTWTGRYYRNAPALSDDLMWGWSGANNETIGGNDLNHPTSRGAAYVYRQLIDAEDWTIPSLTMGNTPYVGTMGRNIGIGTARPRGLLHVTKTPIAADPIPTAGANNYVLEDNTAVGQTLMTGPAGICRYLMGTAAMPDASGTTYDVANGVTALRNKGADVARFIDPVTAGFTTAQLLVNIGGVKSIKQVYVGAAGSGGSGFRSLAVLD